jgi:stage V sporulation protein R
MLSSQYRRDQMVPDIQIVRFARDGDRSLTLRHERFRNRPLQANEAEQVLRHLRRLWGFTVRLETSDPDGRVAGVTECAA